MVGERHGGTDPARIIAATVTLSRHVQRLPVLCRVGSSVAVVVGGDGVRQWWERGTAARLPVLCRVGSSVTGTASGLTVWRRVGSSVTGTASGSPFHLYQQTNGLTVWRRVGCPFRLPWFVAVCGRCPPVAMWARFFALLCPSVGGLCLVPVSVHRLPWWSVQSGNGGREARRHRSGADHCGNCYPIEARPAVAGSLPCLFIGNRYGQRFNRLAVWRFSVPVWRGSWLCLGIFHIFIRKIVF